MDEALLYLFPQEEVITAINGGHRPMLAVMPPLSKKTKTSNLHCHAQGVIVGANLGY